MTKPITTQEVEQRVRHTLSTVAATLTEESVAPAAPPSPSRRSKRRWRIGLGIGAIAVPVVLAAGAVLREGPEYVDTIPPEDIVMTGSVDGSRYLLIESDRTDECGHPVTGVELVEERENLLGSEWDTVGHEYGEPVDTRCGYVNDTSRYLADPALYNDSGSEVGDSFVWVYAVHPDVTAVRITSGASVKDLEVHEVDGAGYAAFEIPEGMRSYTVELLINDHVIPGSAEEQLVPEP
jgi:hypothetical protein